MDSDTLTEEIIDKLTLVQAAGLCEQFQIDSSQSTTLAEVRNLLKDELRRTSQLDAAEVYEALVNDSKKYNEMKSELMQVYEETYSLLDSKSILEGLKEIIVERKVNVLANLKANHRKLKSEDCPIVITGETSAGKSTLLNLLLGEELLPYSVLQKTATICRLRHSANKRIVYTESERTVKDQLDQNFCAEALREKLEKLMENTNVTLIDIYWPIRLLEKQENVILVDTPGLGDNEELAKILLDYLPNAVCFVYVLNCANAGGIEKNKILRLLAEQIKLEQAGENVFDISSTIFVCNKWDQVPAKEDNQVMEYVQTRLEECMTLAKKKMNSEKQIFRFSTTKAMEKMRGNSRSTAEYKCLLETIKELVSGSLEKKYIQLYRWLRESLLENMYETTCTHLRFTWTSVAERMSLQEGVKKRVKKLYTKCEEIKKILEKEGKAVHKKTSKELHKYLHSREVSRRLCTWTDSEVPSSTNPNLAKEIEKTIMEKFRKEIVYWETNDMVFKTNLRNFESIMTERFKSLENEMKELQCMVQGTGRIGDLPTASEKEVFDITDFIFGEGTRASKIFMAVTAPVWLPVSLVLGLVFFPLMGIGMLVSGFAEDAKRAIDKYSLQKEYSKNKPDFMGKATVSFLKKQVSTEYLEKLIYHTYFEEYVRLLDRLCNRFFPEQIKDNERLLDNIINEEDSSSQLREKYRPVQLALRNHLSRLILFRLRFLEKSFINKADVKLKESLSSGSMEHLQKVEYHVNQSWKEYAMKKISSDNSQKLQEIESLLKLKHPNILETLGVMFDSGTEIQNDTINICLLMELCEDTAETVFIRGDGRSCSTVNDLKSKEGKGALRLFTDVGSGTCRALNYMHEHGVLHGNLKLSKILLSNHQAKLTGMGSLQYEYAVNQPTMAGFTHFAPEIFHGKPYYISSDVYSLGIALWEMWFGRRAFSETEYQTDKPEVFASKLMIRCGPDTKSESTPPDKIWKAVQSCLTYDFSKRPKVDQMLNALTVCSP